jgi:hypothetical protein
MTMKSLLLVLVTGVALSSPAFAAHSAGANVGARHPRNYDLRDVQPYPGDSLAACPYGAGYPNTQCSAGTMPRTTADADDATAHHRNQATKITPKVMSSFERMTDIQNSHGML